MDRYWCLAVTPFHSKLTPKRACLLTTITWLTAFIIFLPVASWFREQTTENQLQICTLVFPKNDVVSVSLLCLVPTLLLSCIAPLTMFFYFYQQIYCNLNKTREKLRENNQKNFVTDKPDEMSQQKVIQLNRHVQVIRMLLLNVLVVFVMWLPISGIIFLMYVDSYRPNHNTNFFLRSYHFIWTLLIALLITVANPLLYGMMSKNFRQTFLHNRLLSKQKKACRMQVMKETACSSSKTTA